MSKDTLMKSNLDGAAQSQVLLYNEHHVGRRLLRTLQNWQLYNGSFLFCVRAADVPLSWIKSFQKLIRGPLQHNLVPLLFNQHCGSCLVGKNVQTAWQAQQQQGFDLFGFLGRLCFQLETGFSSKRTNNADKMIIETNYGFWTVPNSAALRSGVESYT